MLGDVVLTSEVEMSERAATVNDATTSLRKGGDDRTVRSDKMNEIGSLLEVHRHAEQKFQVY